MGNQSTLIIFCFAVGTVVELTLGNAEMYQEKKRLVRDKLRAKRQTEIPPIFDARQKWSTCDHISHTTAQGDCLTSWALAAASVISDRICIASEGKVMSTISAQDIIDCCPDCGSCDGGDELKVFQYWVNNGIPSQACKPYRGLVSAQTPVCAKSCIAGYTGNYDQERKSSKGIVAYEVESTNIELIQREIMEYGPITAVISVESDFYAFRGDGVFIGGQSPTTLHTVKIIGWGTKDGIDYWQCVASLGETFGDRGLIKIRRGTNEVKIEELEKAAGLPGYGAPNEALIGDCAQPTDVVFVVDSASASIKTANTVRNAISYFNIGASYQVGIVLSSDSQAIATLDIGVESDKQKLMADLDAPNGPYVYQHGNSPIRMDLGVLEAINVFMRSTRPSAIRLIVILTKSEIDEDLFLKRAARDAKKRGILIAVGATDSIQLSLLSRVASNGMHSFITSDTRPVVPHDKMYYFLPFLFEDICTKTDVCLPCKFRNGIHAEGVNGECDMYRTCRHPGDKNPVKRRCRLGTFWKQEDLSCVWPTETSCFGDPCTSSATNYWASAQHCGGYWKCNNSRTEQLLCCPKFQSWDQATESCIENLDCHTGPYCFTQKGCNHDFILTFVGGRYRDEVDQLWIERSRLKVRQDTDANKWAAYFDGTNFISIPFYANNPMRQSLHIYIRFRVEIVTGRSGERETLLTNGGCSPIEPSFYLGIERSNSKAHGYLWTEDTDQELSLDIDLSRYVELWFTYDGAKFTLETKDSDGIPSSVSVPATGIIAKTHNALKIGSSDLAFFGHQPFIGYVDEVSISRCTG